LLSGPTDGRRVLHPIFETSSLLFGELLFEVVLVVSHQNLPVQYSAFGRFQLGSRSTSRSGVGKGRLDVRSPFDF
jgi:hypothetical protein